MTWVKVDANFFHCPEVHLCGSDAAMLYLRAIAYAREWHLGNRVPAACLKLLSPTGKSGGHLARRLVDAGLWQEDGENFRFFEVWVEDDVKIEPRVAFPPLLRQRLFDKAGNRCADCGTTERLTIDHILPLSRGGSNSPSNLQVLCSDCNASKGTRVVLMDRDDC